MNTISKALDRRINLMIVVRGLGIGGAEVVIKSLAQTIDRRQFNVTVCCIKVRGPIGDELARQGVEVVVLSDPNRKKVDYFTFLKLLKVVRAKKIDILHTHTTDALVDAAVCRLLLPRLKLLHTFHFGNYPHLNRRQMLLERIFSRVADRLLAVSEVQRQQLLTAFRLQDRDIGRVQNGVVFADGEDGRAFRSRLGAENHVLVGTIATLIEQKGLFDLLAVADLLKNEVDRLRFVVVGEGRLRSELERVRRECGLEDMVAFAGWVENAAATALPAFDIFFQPSRWEAMSIALLEAMAAGKAVLATSVGETAHIIDNGVDGMLVNARDVNGMAAALAKLVDSEELRTRLGASAARTVASKFHVEKMTHAYEQIYSQLVRCPESGVA